MRHRCSTAKLLSSRIISRFTNIDILDTVASRQIKEFSKDKELDLIISTVPTDCKNIPQIIVNPLLLEEDVAKIYKFLSTNPPKSFKFNETPPTIEGLMGIIERNCVIRNRTDLVEDIARYINLTSIAEAKGVAQPVLKDLLTEKTIKLNVNASNWEEAIRIGGELLVKNGFVEQRYVEAMVKNVKEMGPYIVIAPGIAMPHARPEDGVKRVCMSLVTLKEPVVFKNDKKVRIMLSLGATDQYSHLQTLSDLMKLFSDSSYVDRILKASNTEEVIKVIELATKEI